MNNSTMRRYLEEEIILQQGSEQREMFKILSGKAVVYFNHGKPDEHLIGVLAEQRCFGELSILCGKASTYTVVAYGEVLVLRITEDTFDDFIRKNSQNAIEIMRNLANSIATLSLNVNLLTEELAAMIDVQPGAARQVQDITMRIRQCATLETIQQGLFTTSV